jgi:hypothetical protein
VCMSCQKRSVKESRLSYGETVPNDTVMGTIVTPFLDSYEPVKEVMVTRCGMVWMSLNTGHEYLLVGDQMLWFGSQMDHSLINPNQIHEYGIPMYNNPSSQSQSGIDCNDDFIPFNTTGTIVYFESRVPTHWEICNWPYKFVTCQLLCLQVKTGTR